MSPLNSASVVDTGTQSSHCLLRHIEQGLRACPAVQDAVVIEDAQRAPHRRLVAYVLPRQGAQLSLIAIAEQLGRSQGDGALPATLIALDAFPVLDDGGIDLAALPSPDSAMLGLRQYEAPHGPVEKAIAAIWQDLLGIRQIGRNAHFFELGGHSSLGIQLVYRLRCSMGVEVALRELFLEPTLQRFAAAVSKRIGAATSERPLNQSRATSSLAMGDAGFA